MYMATPHIASASVKKTDNPILFFGGFTVSLVGLVLFSFALPVMIVSSVIGFGVILFLASLFTKKNQFVISSTGGDTIEIPIGKISKDEVEQALHALQDAQAEDFANMSMAMEQGSASPRTIGTASRKDFKSHISKRR